MEYITAITPLAKRRETKTLIQASKHLFLPDHPMKVKLQGLTKNSFKRCSFVHKSKRFSRINAANLGP